MKKVILLITVFVVLVFVIIANLGTSGYRGGETFQASTIEAMNYYFEPDIKVEPLFEVRVCKDNICLQYFWIQETESIHCASFEEKNGKYAYLYGFSFRIQDITEKLGLEVLEVYNKCEVVYGIMLNDYDGVIINDTILSETVNFSVGSSKYKCWYAIVEGGYDAVESVAYQ